MTGARSFASESGTRSPVVSYPLNMGSPASTTSSSPSTIPYRGSAPLLNRAIFTCTTVLCRNPCRTSRVQSHHPAVSVFAATVLDVGELLPQRHRQLARHGVLRADGEVRRLQLRDGGDHRGCAAGEDLHDVSGCDAVAPLVDRHAPALHPVPAVLRQLQDRVARDALEDAVRLRC